jgi:predicted esterase
MCHGDRDTLVPHEWGEHTFKTLKQLGVNGEFHTIPNALHELKEKELQQLCEWINQCLPPPP